MLGDAGELPEYEVKTLMISGHTGFQEHSSGKSQAGIDRFSGERLNTGRHKKAPVHCPCSQLAALNGAPWMPLLLLLLMLLQAPKDDPQKR